jgi:type II restriction enzyme
MDLSFDLSLMRDYKNKSQIARVLSENWVSRNAYCPSCGNELTEFENNRPVADFFCENCKEEFELKSKKANKIGLKIVDGAYSTMIERITSNTNPNFFFLTYDKYKFKINNFLIIPNFYFIPGIIEKRKPLSSTARRAGWVGCNINLSEIPEYGKIFIVKQSNTIDKKKVINQWKKTFFLKEKKGEKKGWIIDIMNCIDKIDKETFQLSDIYKFESELKSKHPQNNFIKDKIRQQLQFLRDRGLIEFKNRGVYKKIKL